MATIRDVEGRFPDRFVDAVFDSKSDPELVQMLTQYSQNFLEYEKEGLGPALFGKAGAGKTHAAAALARTLVSKNVQVVWANTVGALNLTLDYRDYKHSSYFKLKALLKEARVVVFDDFGQLRDFSRIRELFFEIVDDRYAWKKPTIFTANFEIKSEKDWLDEIGKCFNVALARRIYSMSKGLVYNV